MPFPAQPNYTSCDKACIVGIGCYVPERVLGNRELAQTLDTSDEWIVSHTGIRERRIAKAEQSSADLGAEAAKMALQRAGLQAKNIDLIIVSSSAPDYYGFPSTACILQAGLGCENAAAFDISAACSGFVYALQIGKSLLLANHEYQNILLIAAEKLSSVTNWQDRSTAVLLGDGAGAAILRRRPVKDTTDSSNPANMCSEIIDSVLKADGKGAASLCIPEGGSRNPLKPHDPQPTLGPQCSQHPHPSQGPQPTLGARRNKLEMDGRAVYNFAVAANQEIIRALLERNRLAKEDIAYIVPHQANERIIQAAAKRENIPLERFYIDIASYANTSSASIPIALCEMQQKGLLNRGDLILTIGFGSGLTYGGNLIRW